MRTTLFAATAVIAFGCLASAPALAAPTMPSGSIGGGYSYIDANGGGGGHINDWNVNGSGSLPLGSQFSAQVDGDYHWLSASGSGNLHTDSADINLIWNPTMGRVGATAGFSEIGAGGSSVHFNNYGAFGVWYPNSQFTLGAKVGTLEIASHNFTYYGGEIVGYATPNFAISGTVDGVSISGTTINNYGVAAEWQPWTTTPVSFSLGYTDTTAGGGSGNINTFAFGVKYYFGGGATLVDHHRDGPETWGTKQTAAQFLF